MPIYEYECKICQKRFEKIQHINEPAPQMPRLRGRSAQMLLRSSPYVQRQRFLHYGLLKKDRLSGFPNSSCKRREKEVASSKQGGKVA